MAARTIFLSKVLKRHFFLNRFASCGVLHFGLCDFSRVTYIQAVVHTIEPLRAHTHKHAHTQARVRWCVCVCVRLCGSMYECNVKHERDQTKCK